MTAVPRPSSLPAMLAFAVLAAAALALTFGAQDAAAATCKLSSKEKDVRAKPTYNFTLTQTGTSCATAKKVMKGYHACRSKSSVKCSKKVASKWRCTARKSSMITTQFDARYTCSWGKRRVRGTYQQAT